MQRAEALGLRTFRGVVWSFAERFSSQAIGFVVILVMARLLTPADYGLVGMLTIFIELGAALTDSGFSQALIRRHDRTQADTSTAFFFNVGAGLALYLLIWVLAPHIAGYYGQPLLKPLARVIGLLIPVNALTVVQRALLSAALDFRTQTRACIIAYIISGAAGIAMAYAGWGVWSIALYQILSQGLLCLVLWILCKWGPSLKFSLQSFRSMFGFGSRLAVAGLLDILYRNAYLLVIGKVYKAADLGYFTRAQQIGGFMSANVSGVVQKVSYPALCHFQNDDEALRKAFLKIESVVCFCIFPMMWALIALPDATVYLLLGHKWMYAATLLPVLSLSFMWHPVQSLNLQLLQVKGRSDLFLRVEIVKKLFGVSVMLLAVSYGLEAMCWSLVAGSAFSLICNSWYNGRLYGIGLWRQLRNVGPVFIAGGVAAAAACGAASAVGPYWLKLIAGLAAGAAVYFGWAFVAKRPEPAILRKNLLSLLSKTTFLKK